MGTPWPSLAILTSPLPGERQAWKKAKALVSQRASDRTKKKGTPDVEKDFAEADEDSNRVFDMEERQVMAVAQAVAVQLRWCVYDKIVLSWVGYY